MKAFTAAFVALGIYLFCCTAISSQQTGTLVIDGGSALVRHALTGEPYSADTETEKSQTLSDGTHIHYKRITEKNYRDSAGRTRSEHFPLLPLEFQNNDDLPVSIIISDPGAGTSYQLDPRTRTAHQMVPIRLSAPVTPPVQRQPIPPSLKPTFSNEDLGTQTIEGLFVYGTRSTNTFPVGYQGNDRPMVTVHDQWMSKELGVIVLSTTTSPAEGELTTRLINLSRDEPDPSLFEVPADYTIVSQSQQ